MLPFERRNRQILLYPILSISWFKFETVKLHGATEESQSERHQNTFDSHLGLVWRIYLYKRAFSGSAHGTWVTMKRWKCFISEIQTVRAILEIFYQIIADLTVDWISYAHCAYAARFAVLSTVMYNVNFKGIFYHMQIMKISIF